MESPHDPGYTLRKLTGGDEAAFIRLGNLFVSTTEDAIENLRQSRLSGDCALSMKILHRLKPNVLMFGMTTLHQEILQIEEQWKEQKMAEEEFRELCRNMEQALSAQLSEFKSYIGKYSAE